MEGFWIRSDKINNEYFLGFKAEEHCLLGCVYGGNNDECLLG
jgi:hypothetical protein